MELGGLGSSLVEPKARQPPKGQKMPMPEGCKTGPSTFRSLSSCWSEAWDEVVAFRWWQRDEWARHSLVAVKRSPAEWLSHWRSLSLQEPTN